MNMVLFNPTTQKNIEHFLQKPSHALMLVGPQGSGKQHVAQYICKELLGIDANQTDYHPYLNKITPEEKTTTISQVREAQKLLNLKVPGQVDIKRVLLFVNAHTMTVEAQNAILKSLEEPPKDTVIILTSTSEQQLLPTIVSRVQTIQILPLSNDQLSIISKDQKLLSIAGGRPGLLKSLTSGEKSELTDSIESAKQFLLSDSYERLIKANSLLNKREEIELLIDALLTVSTAAMKSSAGKDKKTVNSWRMRVKQIHDAQKYLQQNVSPKLIITDLALGL